MTAATFGTGQVLWSLIWFFVFFLWIMLLFQITADIFRDRELSGVMKVLWIIFVIALPYLGVLVYVIVRGRKMTENQVAAAQAREQATRQYIRQAAGGSASTADELERLAALHEKGVISAEELASLKAKALGR